MSPSHRRAAMCGAHALLVAAPVLLGTALAAEPNFPITPQMRGTAQQVAQAGCGSHNEKYFYSYHLSKSNFATLTFFSFGKYAPTLTLYNYSPTGELIKRVEVKSSFMDEGLADSTNTYFKNDSTFVVRRWDGYEETNNSKSVLVDSITKTNYIIKSTGRIVKGTHSNESRTQ